MVLETVLIYEHYERNKMRTLGVLIIILGIVLKIVKAVSPGVSWAFIIAGLILLLISYLKKIRSS